MVPAGTITADAAVDFSNSFGDIGLGVDLGYGITDELEVTLSGVGAAVTPDFALNKAFGLSAGYSVIADGDLNLAPALGLGLNFNEGADPLDNISVGLNSRYNLMDNQLSLHFGDGLFSYSLAGESWQLDVALGVAYQINDSINVRVDTNLFGTDGDANSSIADVTPLDLTVIYALGAAMDVGLGLGFGDLQNAGDTMTAGLSFAWRGL